MKNLQTEIDRIMAKERQEGGLTTGQAATMARNEQVSLHRPFAEGQNAQRIGGLPAQAAGGLWPASVGPECCCARLRAAAWPPQRSACWPCATLNDGCRLWRR